MKTKALSILFALIMVLTIMPGSTAATSQASVVANPFTDIFPDDYYYDAVLWALNNQITTGTSATTFSPANTCTRGQVVTFLWRSLGRPDPTSTNNPFNDVNNKDYYYDAVLWAVEAGVTTGTSTTTFSPDDTCTSAQVITFLWRSNGKPTASGTSKLASQYAGQYYTDAVAWADSNHLLDGVGSSFDPNNLSPRADIITYLYRNTSSTDSVSTDVDNKLPETASVFSLSKVPAYDGTAYVAINNNVPYFTKKDYSTTAFELYSDLDTLGRCGVAYANVCKEIMPTEERGDIGMVTPSGWHTIKYDFVDGKYLYNRCHLLGYQLTAENANVKNLITGTRYLNIEGMLPFENMIADYVKETSNHVLYRVTPIFSGNNLVATGVLMEGWSVEDSGEGICFCVFAYNVQPGVEINYATGESNETFNPVIEETEETESPPEKLPISSTAKTYILNTNTKKFHIPSCSSVGQMKEENKQTYYGDRNELIAQGYDPCGRCHP